MKMLHLVVDVCVSLAPGQVVLEHREVGVAHSTCVKHRRVLQRLVGQELGPQVNVVAGEAADKGGYELAGSAACG